MYPRVECKWCRRDVAALPVSGGRWRASRHDQPAMHREFKGALVSCAGSLRPVELEDEVSQLLLPEPEAVEELAQLLF